ncbi:MAG: ATPase, partial [Magnetococcales bacterium]|nr:ATPase [Magnetococcales bacterium]
KQQLVLMLADLINEAFLRQSAFSEKDRFASPQRQTKMMALLNSFMDMAEDAVEAGVEVDQITALPELRRLKRMGEEIGEEEIERFDTMQTALTTAFNGLKSKPDEGDAA